MLLVTSETLQAENDLTHLTLIFRMFPFDLPESIRQPKVFWCLEGNQEGKLGRKRLKPMFLLHRTPSFDFHFKSIDWFLYGGKTGIKWINDTHRERLEFHLIQYRNGWLAASDLFYIFTPAIKFYTFHYQYRCLKIVIHQIGSQNRWLLLSASFTAKFGLVFVSTLENAFS